MKLTVMICEDLEEERMTLARMVRKCCADRRVDLELELTSSGEELLDRFRSRRWDVIFLDTTWAGSPETRQPGSSAPLTGSAR